MPFSRSHPEEASFSASRAAEITDVRPGAQRDWRRRGALPKSEGWMRFFPSDLIDLTLRKVMGDLGMPHVDPIWDLKPAIWAGQAWAATHPHSIEYEDGLSATTDFPMAAPEFRYAWASYPAKSDDFELNLVADFSQLANQTGSAQSLALRVIDLKMIGLQVAERAGAPLWRVRSGPHPGEINHALEKAANGDVAMQEALAALGIDDWRIVADL